MGLIVRVLRGVWEKSDSGEWGFLTRPGELPHELLLKENESFDDLLAKVKTTYLLEDNTKVALTFQFPDWMLETQGKRTPSVDLVNNFSVETFMAIRFEHELVGICVITGDEEVHRYQLQKSGNYSVGGCSTTQGPGLAGGDVDTQRFRGIDGNRYLVASENVVKEIFDPAEIAALKKVAPMSLDTEGRSETHGTSFNAAVGQLNLVTPTKGGPSGDDVDWVTPNSKPPSVQRKTVDKGKAKVTESDVYPMPSLQLRMGGVSGSEPTQDDLTESDDDESLDSSLYGGDGFQHPNQVYVGMIFKNREAFKQHMAMFALTHKFHYRNARSTPNMMVLECNGRACMWRVFATKMEDIEWYQIKQARLDHTCTVDERRDFQRLATTSVIGDMMRSRYTGTGAGPRPAELRDIHDVPISYWKAWRSREMAMDSARGSTGDSYLGLPAYLQQLVHSSPGTVVGLETVFEQSVGQRFKYLFFALGASVEGYSYMRKVIVVDGTHLKGKYAGCLVTASAQDGNYQIFPMAFAIVDGENDKAWQWFFRKLLDIVHDDPTLVFISDRHNSIYSGLRKMYPKAGHCACIVHLQRNVRTLFKKKQLGYLISKAGRAFNLPDFYRYFDQIRTMDSGCAEYLSNIGFEHWARSHFNGSRYNIMTSNVAKCLNAVLAEAREYPHYSSN